MAAQSKSLTETSMLVSDMTSWYGCRKTMDVAEDEGVENGNEFESLVKRAWVWVRQPSNSHV